MWLLHLQPTVDHCDKTGLYSYKVYWCFLLKLYPKELKGIEYDPDESVEDSDDYEEDSDEVVNE